MMEGQGAAAEQFWVRCSRVSGRHACCHPQVMGWTQGPCRKPKDSEFTPQALPPCGPASAGPPTCPGCEQSVPVEKGGLSPASTCRHSPHTHHVLCW